MKTIILIAILFIIYKALRRGDGKPGKSVGGRSEFQKPKDKSFTGSLRSSEESEWSYVIRTEMPQARPTSRLAYPAKSPPKWIPMGSRIKVGGFELPGGIYLGASDRTWSSTGGRHIIDPSLRIDPITSPERLPYWPDYASITPQDRYGYLRWLSQGAKAKEAPLGYVFLYFYGLEYRRYMDSPGKVEYEELNSEIIRLLLVYGDNSSVYSYLTKYIVLDQLDRAEADHMYQTDPVLKRGHELDAASLLALGQAARDRVPLPADWALKLALCYSELRWSTPFARCMQELRELFQIRYTQTYGEGLILKPNKRQLSVEYRSASGEFTVAIESASDLPTVSRLDATAKKVAGLAEACAEELSAYSRYIGRQQEGHKADRTAIGYLPKELGLARLKTSDDPFVSWVQTLNEGGTWTLVTTEMLIDKWDPHSVEQTSSGALTKRSNEAIMAFVEMLGLAIVPDYRLNEEKLKPGKTALVYPAFEPVSSPSPTYLGASTTLKLLAVVANGDGSLDSQEVERMQRYVDNLQEVTEAERLHLRMRAVYYANNPPTLHAASKQVYFTDAERIVAAKTALQIAMADGVVERGELIVLQKLYQLLGLEPENIFSDINSLNLIHSAADVSKMDDDKLPTVLTARFTENRGFPLPDPELTVPQKESVLEAIPFQLDMNAIAAKQAETERAAQLLASVFEDNAEDEEPVAGEAEAITHQASTIVGLDQAHTALLNQLVNESACNIELFETLARAQGLMPGGALEALNEWGFEQFDDLVMEQGDTLELNPDILPSLKQLFA